MRVNVTLLTQRTGRMPVQPAFAFPEVPRTGDVVALRDGGFARVMQVVWVPPSDGTSGDYSVEIWAWPVGDDELVRSRWGG